MEKIRFIPLDPVLTGERIECVIRGSGYSVREIQEILGLLCPQSIYKWMHGRSMPSVDNLYMLHRLFDVHMEDMLVPRDMS